MQTLDALDAASLRSDIPAFRPGDTLLFGRESAGAPEAVHAAAEARVVIPVAARSFNVVTAAAIGLAEALRQVDRFPDGPHQHGHG